MAISQANFYTKNSRGVGVANTQVGGYSVPAATQTMVLTLTLANMTNNAISANIYHNDGTSNTGIVTQAPIPVGGALVLNKIVLQNAHSIYVCSSVAASIDASMSIVEMA
jgi:hypothetical protein